VYHRSDVDDDVQFKDTLKAMRVLDMSEEEQDRVFRIVSAILHLGDVEFERVEHKDEEGSTISSDTLKSAEACCELLKVDPVLLDQVLW
jgi:myosin heavy subunit